ncbi:MAG: Asp-tRNA(Asn)/Glu-tRNA(Gln) amidotransferase subunit GatC [Gammaproteobacteria bacterium]|nr:Asp-tRNA(Asn)/Glu-tRNA(Gln) amidotransferase subunit GatC [Gammaproteobacteria bacterium]
MALSADDLHRAAKLARLNVAPQSQQAQLDALNAVMEMVSAMQSVDTSDVEPMAHPLFQSQVLREDVAVEPNQRDKYQASAPNTDAGYYLVPKVIE